MKPAYLLALLPALAGCSTAASLTYAPTAPLSARSSPAIAAVDVTDARDETDAHYIGAIRGGFGNPLKTLTTAQPVKDEVAAAFVAALQARGLYGQGSPGKLTVTLRQLSGNWYKRREGHTAFSLTLLDAQGRPVYHDDEDVLKVEGSVISLNVGVLASTDDLQAIVTLSLDTAIDQALAKPAFGQAVSALGGARPAS